MTGDDEQVIPRGTQEVAAGIDGVHLVRKDGEDAADETINALLTLVDAPDVEPLVQQGVLHHHQLDELGVGLDRVLRVARHTDLQDHGG